MRRIGLLADMKETVAALYERAIKDGMVTGAGQEQDEEVIILVLENGARLPLFRDFDNWTVQEVKDYLINKLIENCNHPASLRDEFVHHYEAMAKGAAVKCEENRGFPFNYSATKRASHTPPQNTDVISTDSLPKSTAKPIDASDEMTSGAQSLIIDCVNQISDEKSHFFDDSSLVILLKMTLGIIVTLSALALISIGIAALASLGPIIAIAGLIAGGSIVAIKALAISSIIAGSGLLAVGALVAGITAVKTGFFECINPCRGESQENNTTEFVTPL